MDLPLLTDVQQQLEEHVLIVILLVVVVSSLCGILLTKWFYKTFFDTHDTNAPFDNGLDYLFLFKIAFQGLSLQSVTAFLAARVRRRLYVAHKQYVFFGDEIWWIGHPALAQCVFSAANNKNWFKLDKSSVNKLVFAPETPREAMLYTGDDDRWRHARMDLTPFFYNSDFTKLDDQMDKVVQIHLKKTQMKKKGKAELLELMLYVTVDLLCQVLYGCELPSKELDILVDAVAEYTVPGTSRIGKFPGGLDALEYHCKIAEEMGKAAPKGTLAYIISKECPSMTENLKKENLGFFLEALTPAFASFWTICNVCMDTGDMKEKCINDATYRQQCIKESLRMYPPVPVLWPRESKVDQSIENPLYDENAPDKARSLFSVLFQGTPIEDQPTIKIKKGTKVWLVPGVFHYDDRFWVRPNEYLPERWDSQPNILAGGSSSQIDTRKEADSFGGLNVGRKSQSVFQSVMKARKAGRSKNIVEPSMRTNIFGYESEAESARVLQEHLFESTPEKADQYSGWTFEPFGLGQHACLGRRLAVRMVDSIVLNCLEHDVSFDKGVIPSMFTRKQWFERIVATNAAYNYPADPVRVNFRKKEVGRKKTTKSFIVAPIVD